VKVILRGVLTVKRTGPGHHDKEYFLFDYPAPPALVNVMGLQSLLLLAVGLIGFWNGFFEIDSYFRCNLNVDGSIFYLSETPCPNGTYKSQLITHFTYNYRSMYKEWVLLAGFWL